MYSPSLIQAGLQTVIAACFPLLLKPRRTPGVQQRGIPKPRRLTCTAGQCTCCFFRCQKLDGDTLLQKALFVIRQNTDLSVGMQIFTDGGQRPAFFAEPIQRPAKPRFGRRAAVYLSKYAERRELSGETWHPGFSARDHRN